MTTNRRTNGTHIRARAALVVGIVVATMAAALTAGAAPVQPSITPVAGWSTNGPVYATAIIGDTVYAGGNFTQVRNQGGTQTLTRTNLAAFDRVTGAIRSGWSADTNGVVRALATDGTRLYVGGSFTTLKGVTRQRLGALDPTTGAVNTQFVANATSHVYVLTVLGSRLYVGGAFGTIKGVARTRVAAVNTVTGAVDPTFAPALDNSVRSIAPTPDGASVFVGGQFTSLGGVAQSYLGRVSATTGANTGFVLANAPTDQVIALDISPTGRQLFVGSMNNRAASYDTVTGARQWFQRADGDIQAIRYRAGNVFFGFHDGFAGDTTAHLLVADAATGVLEPWKPTINSFFGVWAIAATDDALAVGGEFTTFSGIQTQGVAVLGNSTADTVAPTAPTAVTVTGTTASSVTLSWGPGTDNVGVGGYRVVRDGVEIAYLPGTTITDTGLPAGTSFTYAIQTVDRSGNRSAPAPVTAGTDFGLVGATTTWRYSDRGTDLGTAWRASGYDDTAWAAGAGQLGYGDGDEATVVSFGGNTTNRYPTTYFRRHFDVANPAALGTVTLRLLRDDGAVAYLNGVEIARSNMPAGTIGYTTHASSTAGSPDESTYFPFTVNPALLVAGDNVLAVEVHQINASSNDLSFDAALDATRHRVPPVPTNLHAVTSTNDTVTLAWDGSADATGGYRIYRDGVAVGTVGAAANPTIVDPGLTLATTYHYQVSAIDDRGTETAPSPAVAARTTGGTDVSPPSTPGALRTTARSGSAVSLAWDASTDDTGVAGYVVTRDGVDLPTVTTTALTDSGLASAVAHSYTVRALDASDNASAPTASLVVAPHAALETVFSAGSVWKYTDDGIERGTAWKETAYDDTTWKSGAGQLGYGDGDETTVMYNGGSVVSSRYISHYLRRGFDVSDVSAMSGVTLSVLRDDGVVVYVNGVEAFRDNMPAGAITSTTFASTGLSGADESTYVDFTIPSALLVEGHNVIAVSVHNNSRSGSGDLSFDARLTTRF